MKIVQYIVIACAAHTVMAWGDVIVQYSFTASNLLPTVVHTDVTAGGIVNGGRLSQMFVNLGLTNYPSAPVMQVNPGTPATNDVDFTFSTNNFFQFTITVDPGLSLSLSNLTFNAAKGGSGTRATGVRTDLTGTNNLTAFNVGNTRPNWPASPFNVDLFGFSELQGITNSVTFMFAVATPSTGNSLEFDDITVNGAVVPEPSVSALVLLGLGALAAICGCRRRTRTG
jgi:hypothetical protein